MATRALAAGLLLLLSLASWAADRPDMTKQKTWGQKEKDTFYEWLREQGGASGGADEGQMVSTTTFEQQQIIPGTLSNKYLSTRFVGYDLFGFTHQYGSGPEEGGEGEEPAEGEDDVE